MLINDCQSLNGKSEDYIETAYIWKLENIVPKAGFFRGVGQHQKYKVFGQ